tara:strand:+ start:7394 stop:7918 length:525 start_codon:yes stop_codon:yes gene_type:complete
MSTLTYTVIKTEEQYYEYCDLLEEIAFSDLAEEREDEMELLTLLVKTWDKEHFPIPEMDPVELLKSFMEDHDLKQADLVEIAGVGKSTISEILNYKKRMSKAVIRNIAEHFKIQQEALNKSYRLEGEGKTNDFESHFSPVMDAKLGNAVSYTELIDGLIVQETKPEIYKPEIEV